MKRAPMTPPAPPRRGGTAVENLVREVAENGDATQSALVLIGALADQIRQNADDPVQVEALAEQLHANTTALAQAVVANTMPRLDYLRDEVGATIADEQGRALYRGRSR